MKIKITIFLIALLLTGKNMQADPYTEDCAVTLSLFVEAAKIENYTTAYPYLLGVRKNCASFHLSIYQYGEKIYKHRIETATAGQKMAEFQELKKLYNERLQNFPDKTTEGGILSEMAQVMFDYSIGTKMEQYNSFDQAYNNDKENFIQPKAIYTYFSLAVELQELGEMPVQKVFDLYDEVTRKLEEEENALAARITPLIEKQDNGDTLSSNEANLLRAGETNLRAYSQVKGSVNGKLGILADCPNLIPMYERDFEERKTDVEWLQAAASRISAKECESPLFFKLVKQLHTLNPSSRSAYYLGQLADAEGKSKVALNYYVQSAELEQDDNKKANTYYRIAENYRKSGNFSQARTFYRKTIEAKPSHGRAYLQIASMYAASSNDCGDSIFERRAINWLAADLARTAARVDPSVATHANAAAESYMGRAPSRSDIFDGWQGKTVTFNCWVGGSVKVPNL